MHEFKKTKTHPGPKKVQAQPEDAGYQLFEYGNDPVEEVEMGFVQ